MTRWWMGVAVLAVIFGLPIRALPDPPDLVVKTKTFLAGKDAIAADGKNYIYVPTAPQNGRLMVLFAASSMDRYKAFMTLAAAHGYHVLGLDSPITAAKGDAENAITHRLVAILEYLKAEKQGSGQFLLCRDAEACAPDWPKLVVAGHGDGAGIALWLLARHHGNGMKALISAAPAVPGLDTGVAAWKNDVSVVDTANCPGLEAAGAGHCDWDRLLAPY